MTDLFVKRLERLDPRLGRQIVHDPRSRAFPFGATVDTTTWRSRTVRVYDPLPNPNQTIGNCTGCAKATQLNSVGNRVSGVVLKMSDADRIYSLATTLDPWAGSYPPDDTGSSGLAAAKAAQQLGLGGAYRWLFGGANEVVQAVMEGRTVNVGTMWYYSMFSPWRSGNDPIGIVAPAGQPAGGHEWTVRGYDVDRDLVLGRCWWGEFRDFWIMREHLDELLHDDGDAHVQDRA